MGRRAFKLPRRALRAALTYAATGERSHPRLYNGAMGGPSSRPSLRDVAQFLRARGLVERRIPPATLQRVLARARGRS